MKAIDLNGRRFGRLVVSERTPGGRCVAACDCGKTHDVRVTHLLAGKIRSCGCLANEVRGKASITHGGSAASSPEYQTWLRMRRRCHSEAARDYSRYGGRGIEVCQEWRDDFSRFRADMGTRPSPVHSIERIDNDLGYEPGNCKWATADEQAKNKRSTIRVDVEGVSMCLKDACEKLGLSYKAVELRIKRYKWPMDRALSEPIRESAR